MPKDTYPTIRELMASKNPEELHQGLKLIKDEISKIGSNELQPLFEIVSTIYYIDPWDHPELMPILDEAISLVVGFGRWIIPELVKNLDSTDIKAQFAIAHALGRIGNDAIQPLMEEYKLTSDPAFCSFILYTMGKIKSPGIVQASLILLEAAKSENFELRDTAIRAIGKFAESIPALHLPVEMKEGYIKTLHKNLADTNSGIRAKSVRSLGKLAKYGHLDSAERTKLKKLFHIILGTDDMHEWDRAYVVRKEAAEAITYV